MNSREVAHTLEPVTVLCRERGVRLTRQRKAILQLLLQSDKPLSAYGLPDQNRYGLRLHSSHS